MRRISKRDRSGVVAPLAAGFPEDRRYRRADSAGKRWRLVCNRSFRTRHRLGPAAQTSRLRARGPDRENRYNEERGADLLFGRIFGD
jgi:hypothetical protein